MTTSLVQYNGAEPGGMWWWWLLLLLLFCRGVSQTRWPGCGGADLSVAALLVEALFQPLPRVMTGLPRGICSEVGRLKPASRG
ncbi:uncharacterized protein B0H64DRAFT_390708 [Chaetomium fimeti]|uniref:Uncharacterized protein n=1 Tax=Chaetomium fimeti TaxID=1854472 RepID=A0AAE0HI06_9PEZI|nr:hypothetical protein B0H64DRAFT_390708 [Chaetomium fimeti]